MLLSAFCEGGDSRFDMSERLRDATLVDVTKLEQVTTVDAEGLADPNRIDSARALQSHRSLTHSAGHDRQESLLPIQLELQVVVRAGSHDRGFARGRRLDDGGIS